MFYCGLLILIKYTIEYMKILGYINLKYFAGLVCMCCFTQHMHAAVNAVCSYVCWMQLWTLIVFYCGESIALYILQGRWEIQHSKIRQACVNSFRRKEHFFNVVHSIEETSFNHLLQSVFQSSNYTHNFLLIYVLVYPLSP